MATSKNNLCLILLLISILFLKPNFYLCLETISINQPLFGDQTIISKGGNFELGFQNPGNTSKYYISMWYKKVSTITIAWVANRETPVTDKFSSVLKISKGNLVLFDESQSPVWSTNCTPTTSNSTIALLRDDGNLVLLDGPNSKIPVWQSFDFPTDTWFLGGKLAYNKITKTHQRLTSWKNLDDPSLSLYSFSLDVSTNQYFLSRNRTEQYWGTGPWNGHIFSLMPEMKVSYIFNFSYVDNENESYFIFSLYDTSIITRFIVDVSGQVKQFTWLEPSKEWNLFWSKPQQQCEVHAFCGPFSTCNSLTQPFCGCLLGFKPKSSNETNLGDYSGGCIRRTKLLCGNYSGGNRKKDKFFVLTNVKLPSNPFLVRVRRAFDCKSSCLNNCSCTAYAYDENKCSIWIGELLNIEQLLGKDGRGRTLNLKLSASEFSSSKNNKGVVIGIVTGSGFVVVLLCFVFLVILRSRRGLSTKTKTVEGSLVMFSYRDLQNATRSFSEKLGGGGFGSVFKGELSGSSIIAVKKLESISQGEKQFRNEVSTIGTIQHINLVRLRGFCSEGSNRLLVYDYMQNGSLDAHLFLEKDQKVLDWKTRYQIAVGTARGLAYLHEECIDCIIHCDIKPENVLLDCEFLPKLADFGLAKLVGRKFSRVLTTMRGTRGYLAPEWISGVAITTKADVYSFGMMVLEIVSGMRNSGRFENGRFKYFPVWVAWVVAQGGDMLSLLDHRLDRASVDIEGLTRMCRIACWCIQDEEDDRPTMKHVVQVLEGVLDVSPSPIPSSLESFVDDVDQEGEC